MHNLISVISSFLCVSLIVRDTMLLISGMCICICICIFIFGWNFISDWHISLSIFKSFECFLLSELLLQCIVLEYMQYKHLSNLKDVQRWHYRNIAFSILVIHSVKLHRTNTEQSGFWRLFTPFMISWQLMKSPVKQFGPQAFIFTWLVIYHCLAEQKAAPLPQGTEENTHRNLTL